VSISRPPEARPHPLLGLLRRQPRPTAGTLTAAGVHAEWDGEHLSLFFREGTAGAASVEAEGEPEPLRLVQGEPIEVLLSATQHDLAGDAAVVELFGDQPLVGHQLHVELRVRAVTVRLLAPAPADVVGDLPLRSSFGDETSLDDLIGLLRQLAANGAELRVPVVPPPAEPPAPGLDQLGAGHQREVDWLWRELQGRADDVELYQRLEIIYGSNALWRPLCEVHEQLPHGHGRERLIAILERVARLFDEGPELSHLWLRIGEECEALDQLEHARFAYFKAFQAWAQNVRAVDAKLQLERRTGNLAEYRKMLGVRRKLLLGYAGATVAYLKLALELVELGELQKAEYVARLAARLPATAGRRRALDLVVGWIATEPERAASALHQLTDEFFGDDDDAQASEGDGDGDGNGEGDGGRDGPGNGATGDVVALHLVAQTGEAEPDPDASE
jgi:tetratricopeptide (TPR) repeat protein